MCFLRNGIRANNPQAEPGTAEKLYFKVRKQRIPFYTSKRNHANSFCTDPDVEIVESPLNANVWKVLVKDGDAIEAGQTLLILEAMKMEVHVKADTRFSGHKVERVWTEPSDSVHSGQPLLVLRA